MSEFPKWKHGRTESVIVKSDAEWARMDQSEWADSPAAFLDGPAVEPPETIKRRPGRPAKGTL